MLMASVVVVLKHETSTPRQSHNFISIDFTFGLGDYVRKVTSPAKFGSDPMSGLGATWDHHNTGLVTVFVYRRHGAVRAYVRVILVN